MSVGSFSSGNDLSLTNGNIPLNYDSSGYTYRTYLNYDSGAPYDTSYNCANCGARVGMYQAHACPTQLTFPQLTFPTLPVQVPPTQALNSEINAMKQRIAEVEKTCNELLELMKGQSHNSQDEEVHVRSQKGHQGADQGGGSESPRDRKGDWFWPPQS